MECADADKYDRIYCNALTVINKIVFTSPEAMVEFSGEKNITALVKTNIYSFERSILLRATGKQKSPITNHATTLCKECEIKSLSILASHADVLRLVTRSSPRTRDKPKNVCVGGYFNPGTELTLNHAISIVSNG